jgi:Uma2 family endonuclease
MSTVASELLTTEQLLAIPDDGMDRELIQGHLRIRPMTKRNRFHTLAVTRLAFLLESWLDNHPESLGEVHTGEVGTILRRDPDTTVGIDVAFFSADVMARQTERTSMIEGAPRLAVEVISPSDKQEEVREKVVEYINAGGALVWIVDPYFETVQVYRPRAEPEMFNREQVVSGGDVLPGLEIAVARIFKRSGRENEGR